MLIRSLKTTFKPMLSIAAVAALGLTPLVSAQADSHIDPVNNPTFEEVQQAFADAAAKVSRYTEDQRDEALAEAKNAIAVADQEIRRMENKLDDDWSRLSQTARRDARQAMRELNEQRFVLARRLGNLESSTADAWEEVQSGFNDAVLEMKHAMQRARLELQSDESG